MLGFSLQFRGVENARLLAMLAAAVSLALVGYGIWQMLLLRQRRQGAVALLAGVAAAAAVLLAAGRLPLDSPAQRVSWLVLLAVLIVLAVGVFYSAVYAYLGRRRMTALLALRFLAILALLLILFKPALSFQPGGPARRLALPVLVDRSASMNTIDHADLPNRYRQSVEGLAAQARRMSEHFRVGWLHFAKLTQAVESGEELAALAPAEPEAGTDLVMALRRAAAGYGADELAGLILVSDGIHNADGDVLGAARESPVPVHVVGVGSETEQVAGQRNVRVLGVEAPLEAIRNNVTTVAARLRLTAWANISTRVTLTENGQEVASRQVLADSNAQDIDVKLEWTPGDPPAGSAPPDVRKLKIVVQPNPAETTADDNAAELHVLVVQPSIRVLYVEGTLRPEYKFLRRALATDPNVKFISLVRFRDNRFLSQGSIDGKRLSDLPRTDEEFQFFDVIILGDLDRTFLTSGQMERIRRSVYEGKALLMLGGRNSFGPGGYGGTPIESALPVFCGSRAMGQETTRFVPQLTAAGVNSPIFAGLGRHFHSPSARAADPLPELLGCVQVARAKPHAQLLAVHPNRRSPDGTSALVVLALHQYGKGRAAAFTADTTWQWFMRRQLGGAPSAYYRFWGQLLRYLAGVEEQDRKTAASVVARLDKPYLRQGEQLKIIAQVKDAAGQAEADATVSAELSAGPSEQPTQVAMMRSQAGEGLYEATFRPARPGRYAVTVTALDKAGTKMADDELPVVVAPYARETDRLARDAKTLDAIAERSGGRYVELSRLPDVIDEIIQRQQSRLLPAPAAVERRLYDFTLLFLIFVGLLTTEWMLRRNWQLQ